jgi:CubicO group peptidase (beta-lactamase class C family)
VREARALVQQDQAAKGYPGIAIAVSVDEQTVWSEGFGYADLEHRLPMTPSIKFRVGSIAKPMTTAAVVTLSEEGRLDLDVPIQRYVPTFPEKSYPITARQLGGHLAGIRHYEGAENFIRDPYATVVDGLAIFKDDPLLHEPGTAYRYSTYGFNLLSAVVEGASGHDFLTYMRDAVFRPLGMNDTVPDFVTSIIPQRAGFYVRTEDGDVVNAPFVNNSYKWAGGGFLSTTHDLLRFANAHLGDDYLSDAAKQILFTEQQTRDGNGVGYGLGWFGRTDSDGQPSLYHSGGSVGGTSLLIMHPDAGVVVVGLINLTRADNGIVRDILALFVEAVSHQRTELSH